MIDSDGHLSDEEIAAKIRKEAEDRYRREHTCIDDDLILRDTERNLIKQIRQISFGRVVIFIENKIPVRIEEIRESIRL